MNLGLVRLLSNVYVWKLNSLEGFKQQTQWRT